MSKATPEQIRERFDHDVERFSNLDTGQISTVDAAYVLELIQQCVAAQSGGARALLDVGCGAGNFSLKLSAVLPQLEEVTLVDLSRPMLDRASERLSAATSARISAVQQDIRALSLPKGSIDIAVGAAVFHHLREEQEWLETFQHIHAWLRPSGTLWIWDLVSQEWPAVQNLMWQRYGDYLESLKGADYRKHVLDYVEFEDTPRPVTWQLKMLERAGFASVELLHKNGSFAAFCAQKHA